MGRGLFLRQPRPPSQGDVTSADPNFGGSPLLMRTRFDLNDQIRRGNTYGGVLGGQSRHCILYKCVARFISDSLVSCKLQQLLLLVSTVELFRRSV